MSIEDFLLLVSEIAKIPLEVIEDHSSLRNDLGIDSLQLVNLIVLASERFGMELNKINSLEDVQTVGKLYRTFSKGE